MVAEGRHINVYLALVPVDVLLCPFVAAPCKDNPGITSDTCGLRKTHVALEAEKHERPGSSELACIGNTKAQIFLSDKDTHEKAVYSNTASFHLQARVDRVRIATRLRSTTSITITTTNHHQQPPTTTSFYLSPRLYPSDMVGACDRSGVAIAIVKTTLLQDRVT